ncbi:hypothetical protein BOSE62_71418 [Bosea sp. 62]|nr:hypothetical protein BOSE21B_90199 [Bosea sp. 21B]CAD5294733.1 hypothetical protein BOSE46_80304 [Bosea sp. 46]CAD5298881.1 hypothetical protein BOSE7B_60464 [Bosea sp. 7B]VVT60846.1 hypothetical protein BOS5A_230123 [Bosea sp. EC-HK365B]VXB39007.1 hypothetical protein BOSE127_110463 [Bosea sp. 127]VXB55111.1 hypothetical protein BOSE125_131052 [Bosea sp. 125]VXC74850.1 hypothetical protein BOSE29B_80194 [Bosea sp. 29B]VXC91435.1 hypothetical protein BOSE62_71418 [Bosea sp. 62]
MAAPECVGSPLVGEPDPKPPTIDKDGTNFRIYLPVREPSLDFAHASVESISVDFEEHLIRPNFGHLPFLRGQIIDRSQALPAAK